MVIAHFGHWLVGLLQFIPVVVFIGWLVYNSVKDRRKEKAEAAQDGDGEPAPDG